MFKFYLTLCPSDMLRNVQNPWWIMRFKTSRVVRPQPSTIRCVRQFWQSGNGGRGGGWCKVGMTDTKQLWFTANAIISILFFFFFLKLRSIYSVSYFIAEYPVSDNTSEIVDYLRLSRNVFLNEFQIVWWKSKKVESCFNRKSKEFLIDSDGDRFAESF